MSQMRFLSLLGLLWVVGCNNNTGRSISFAFNRPERLDFACLAQYAPGGLDPAKNDTWTVLPRLCCTYFDASAFQLGAPATGPVPYPDRAAAQEFCVGTPAQPLRAASLHALVTQSTRGEVAAVDLAANRVLDSDRQVPGFTFLDSGGLPSAIVVPTSQPKGDGTKGPAFFYVASIEDQSVRAIPTCRFRGGARCGPDREGVNVNDPVGYAARLRVPLPGAPEDMILGPDQALWLTIPRARLADGSETGVIMRVELPEASDPANAFALDAATNLPQRAQWFGVPAMEDAPMAEPVIDGVDYRSSCGLRIPYAATSFTLPIARREEVRDSAEPARLRFDEESGLLLASDRESPGVHVFRPGLDGSLTALGSLRTGLPLRDFVLTPTVPSSAVQGVGLLAREAPAEDTASETKRYLYGIDENGMVAVFDFVADDADDLPVLTPLLAPVPDLSLMRYADRLALPAPAEALEIIDTRSQSGYTCGEQSIDDLRALRNAINAEPRPLPTERARELARVEARITIYDTAANDYLRGVFLGVASTAGRLTLVDVHDLDSSCRAQKYCCASGTGAAGQNGVPTGCTTEAALDEPRSSDAQESLMVRRHTSRRRSAGPQIAEVSTSSLLATQVCDANDPHAARQVQAQVCTPADAYTQLSESWRVDWQGTLPLSQMVYAHWESGGDEALGQLTLVAPTAFDMCARGVEVGDVVAVLGRAPEGLRATCPDPSADSAQLLTVREARFDRLVVEPVIPAIANETAEARGMRLREVRARLFGCYPDFVGAELRAGGFLVLGSGGTYLHRVVRGLDGTCVADLSQDELFNARVRTGTIVPSVGAAPVAAEVFRNPYVSFALAPAGSGVLPETRETAVTVSRASVPFYTDAFTAGDSVTNALPSALQYFPEQGYLFLLDTAGQGLRRYTLRPFQRDTTVFR